MLAPDNLDPTQRAALVPPLVTRASAALAEEPYQARMLLVDALRLTLGDPCDVMLDADPRPLREQALDVPERAPAVHALATVAEQLIALAGEPPAPAEFQPEVCESANAPVTRLAAWLCGLLPGDGLPERWRAHLDEEARTWARARSLLFGGAVDADAAEIARNVSEVPLARAAAALRLGADDIARGLLPRPETWSVMASLVPTFHDSWGQAWAPRGLFQDAADDAGLALLSPASRVRFGASSPELVANLVKVLLVGLDAFPDVRRQRAAWAAGLIRFAFGARSPRWPGTREEGGGPIIPPALELAPLEREVLVAVATKVSILQWEYDVHHALCAVALPATFEGTRRWLGLDPPGTMNVPVSINEAGQERVLPLALAVQRFVAGTVAASDLAAGIAKGLTPEELAHFVTLELLLADARLHSTGPERTEEELTELLRGLKMMAIERADPDAVAPALLKRADTWLKDTWDLPAAPSVVWEALARLLGARGDFIPPRFDKVIAELATTYPSDPAPVRTILLSLPQARRDAIVVYTHERPAFRGRNDFNDLLSEEMRQDPIVQRPRQQRAPNALTNAIESLLNVVHDETDPT